MPRVKLSELHKSQRENICNKLIEIVGNEFYLCDLDADISKQNAIMELKDEIPKYFAVSGISTFKKSFDAKRDYLSLVKGILKQQGYTIVIKRANKKINDHGLVQQTSKYEIIRDNINSFVSENNYI
jgi:hypothetical protein